MNIISSCAGLDCFRSRRFPAILPPVTHDFAAARLNLPSLTRLLLRTPSRDYLRRTYTIRRITLPAYRITCWEAARKFGDAREENAEIKAGKSLLCLPFAGIAKALDGFFQPDRSVSIRPARTKSCITVGEAQRNLRTSNRAE
ncbi:MAG: hypothetical protein LBT05_07380 [Planctomycetaceae bacterium]|nr:hypothetical protein [Planctomycetaceae bacterium]